MKNNLSCSRIPHQNKYVKYVKYIYIFVQTNSSGQIASQSHRNIPKSK